MLVPEEEFLEDPARGEGGGRGDARVAGVSVDFVSFSVGITGRGNFRSPFLIVSERSLTSFVCPSGEFLVSSAAFSDVSQVMARPGVGSEEERRLGGL